jgi:hypothetical protein
MNQANPDSTADWLAAIRQASNEEILLGVVRRYVTTRTAEHLADIPAALRPRVPETRDDILECAVTLAREELKRPTDSAQAANLRQMVAVFAEASTRLTRMVDRGAGTSPPGSDR